jgi:CRP/FNR family transcriptional regulator
VRQRIRTHDAFGDIAIEEEVMNAAAESGIAPFHAAGSAPARTQLRAVALGPASCSSCNIRRICLPVDLDPRVMQRFDEIVTTRVRLRKGETLFHDGAPFRELYAIRSGSCKTVLLTEDGQEQVSGYHMQGDILGIDGIDGGLHGCRAVALEDTEACALPFDRIEALARADGGLQHGLHRLFSREIVRERNVMLTLGTMRAEQRLASFLLDLSKRYQARGYSSTEFVLRMTREEIGSHLGLKLETVSRFFSRFHQEGFVLVAGRVMQLLDRVGLRQLLEKGAR